MTVPAKTRQSQTRKTMKGQKRTLENWDANKQVYDDSCDCELCHTKMMKQILGDRGCGCDWCQETHDVAGVGVKCEMWDNFIDTRGFAMRRGHGGRVVHHCSAQSALPGRCSFKWRAGGHRDVYRCPLCKPGRHHGPGGAKSLKNVRGSQVRMKWLDVHAEVRQAEHAAKEVYDVMPSKPSPNLTGQTKPPSSQETAAAMRVPEQPSPVPMLPGPLSISLRRCQCPDCPQRRRRLRYSIIPESGGQKEKRETEAYDTILADLPNIDEWSLEVGQEWTLL